MPVTCVYDRAELAKVLHYQHGVITRLQALACGMSEKAIRHALRKPNGWRAMLPGVYLTVSGEPTTDQRDAAALLYAGPGSLLTGAAAIRRHGLPSGNLDVVDVLIRETVQRKSMAFVRILRTTRMPDRHRSENGIRFAYLPRAIGDAVRGLRDFREVEAIVCMAIQQSSCTVSHLVAELQAGPTTGTRWFRAALAEVSEGVRSTAESDLKRRVERAGIEKPLYNPMLYLLDGTFLCSPDLWWERHGVAGEVDSLAYHFKAKDYEETIKRHNRVEGAGIHLLHWTPGTITREADTVIRDIRVALADATNSQPPKIITVPAGHPAPPGCRPPSNGRR